MISLVLWACLLTKAPADLRLDYCRATWAWLPYHAEVKEVKWCEDGEWVCNFKAPGGGGYDFASQTITIDRTFPFPTDGVFLTLSHEIGHALGLMHSPSHTSIMRSGWEPPLAAGPSEEDKEELKKLLDKSNEGGVK